MPKALAIFSKLTSLDYLNFDMTDPKDLERMIRLLGQNQERIKSALNTLEDNQRDLFDAMLDMVDKANQVAFEFSEPILMALFLKGLNFPILWQK